MNCQSFENVVNELVREQAMEADLREGALRHSAVCEACAERLSEERELTNDLRQVAAQVRASQPSPAIEATLLAVFRRHSAAQPISPQVGRLPGNHRYLFYAAPIAAMLLIVIGLAALRFPSTPGAPPESPTTEVVNAGRPPGESLESAIAQPIQPSNTDLHADKRRSPKRKGATRAGKSTITVEIAKLVAVNNPEITSEFIPIGYSTASSVQEGGQLVRVELSRSTMAQFGFPINMERYDERVKADVWVGVDGLARAIRFVQ